MPKLVDSVKVSPSTRATSVSIATDEINDIHYPIYKIAIGANGVVTFIDDDNPIPVNVVEAGTKYTTDTVTILNEISKKLSTLIKYEAILHKVDLEDDM